MTDIAMLAGITALAALATIGGPLLRFLAGALGAEWASIAGSATALLLAGIAAWRVLRPTSAPGYFVARKTFSPRIKL